MCRNCGKNFMNKHEMMDHRKREHEDSCKPCNQFQNGKCRFENACWYKHVNVNEEICNYGSACRNIKK